MTVVTPAIPHHRPEQAAWADRGYAEGGRSAPGGSGRAGNTAGSAAGQDLPVLMPSGRLRQPGLADGDRGFAVAIHLTPFLWLIGIGPIALLGPLVIWLIRKDGSPFNDDHGREVINFGLSYLLLHLILVISIVGMIALPVLWIVGIVSLIRGAIAAGNGEYFRYPMTFRFLS